MMTDDEIIQGLIRRDAHITQEFFFLRCKPLIYSFIKRYYPTGADYDELVNDLYLHLMENDARRLRQYRGDSSVYQWLKRVANNYYLDRKKRERMIEPTAPDRLSSRAEKSVTDNSALEAEMDIAAILDQIENENYRLVLRKVILEGMSFDELEKITGKSKACLYNIKKRAMAAMEKIARVARARGDALCAVRCEEYILHCLGIHRQLGELKALALSRGWLSEEGALVGDLGNTAAHFGLKVEKMQGVGAEALAAALAEGRQVIAAVDGGELIGDPVEERLEDVFAGGVVDHCVVVLSVDLAASEVALYDPAFGVIPLIVSKDHFLDAWADSGRYFVAISRP